MRRRHCEDTHLTGGEGRAYRIDEHALPEHPILDLHGLIGDREEGDSIRNGRGAHHGKPAPPPNLGIAFVLGKMALDPAEAIVDLVLAEIVDALIGIVREGARRGGGEGDEKHHRDGHREAREGVLRHDRDASYSTAMGMRSRGEPASTRVRSSSLCVPGSISNGIRSENWAKPRSSLDA